MRTKENLVKLHFQERADRTCRECISFRTTGPTIQAISEKLASSGEGRSEGNRSSFLLSIGVVNAIPLVGSYDFTPGEERYHILMCSDNRGQAQRMDGIGKCESAYIFHVFDSLLVMLGCF